MFVGVFAILGLAMLLGVIKDTVTWSYFWTVARSNLALAVVFVVVAARTGSTEGNFCWKPSAASRRRGLLNTIEILLKIASKKFLCHKI